MRLFDLSKVSSFQVVDLQSLPASDLRSQLSVSRRRELLLASNSQGSLEWQVEWASYLFDIGSYAAALECVERVIEASETSAEPKVQIRAMALHCRAQSLLGLGGAVKPKVIALETLVRESDDPFIKATHFLVEGAYRAAGATGEPDAISRSLVFFREAASLFEQCGEIDLAILCRSELAAMIATSGAYVSAIKEIECAMDLAERHNRFFYTGRLLAIGGSAATDQGYRIDVESTLRRSLEWSEFVGDFWAQIQGQYALARLLSYQIPVGDPVAAIIPEQHFHKALHDAEEHGARGVAGHISASLAWLYQKSGEAERRQRLLDSENEMAGGRRGHFDGMFKNTNEVVKRVNDRLASRLQDGIENYPDAFFIFDARRDAASECIDFINEYRNQAAANMLDVRPGFVFLYSEAKQSPHLKNLTEPLIDAFEQKTPFQDLYSLDNEVDTHWFARRIVPSENGAILIVRDVTAERRIERALLISAQSAERSDRAKSEFLANMSHEIRTPINGVLGLARLLADTPLTSSQRSYVEDIIGSGDILISVIGNVLDLSKMESHSMPLDERPTVVAEVINSTVRLYQGQAKEKGIELSTVIESSTPKAILADGARIRQVLANLIGNAVKFTSKGFVSITVGRQDEMLTIDVSDTGAGIPTDRLEAIFDRFQQASADSRVFGGTGLGLTISRGIVDLMGGTISVTSRMGEGSRFTVRLPFKETEDILTRHQSSLSVRCDGVRVLLVEDNRVNQMVSEYALQKLGCIVTVSCDGAEALEKWEESDVDIVLMDIRMPVLDGLEATRELRRREVKRGTRTPVVALTAGALVEERKECFDAGMDDYISKPFNNDLLQEVLAKWLPEDRTT